MSTLNSKSKALSMAFASLGKMVRDCHHQQENPSLMDWVMKVRMGEWDVRHEITVKLVEFSQLYASDLPSDKFASKLKLSEVFSQICLQVLARHEGNIGIATERVYDAFEIGTLHGVNADTVNRCIRRLVGELDRNIPMATTEFFRLLKMAGMTIPELKSAYFGLLTIEECELETA